MPVVPFVSRPNSTALPPVDPTMLMMAAAELHSAGRLIESEYRDGKMAGPQPNVSDARPTASFGGRSTIEANNPELGPSESELERRKIEMEAKRQRDRK